MLQTAKWCGSTAKFRFRRKVGLLALQLANQSTSFSCVGAWMGFEPRWCAERTRTDIDLQARKGVGMRGRAARCRDSVAVRTHVDTRSREMAAARAGHRHVGANTGHPPLAFLLAGLSGSRGCHGNRSARARPFLLRRSGFGHGDYPATGNLTS